MKLIVRGMVFALVFLTGCAGGGGSAKAPVMLGPITQAQLPAVFRAVYDTTHVDKDFIELIQRAGGGVETKVFLGTWCPDSHREVPRFLKVVELAGASLGAVRMYGLDRNMKSPGGDESSYDIERVPTFIFLKQGQEIGRIVETPKVSMEGDMLSILASAMNQ